MKSWILRTSLLIASSHAMLVATAHPDGRRAHGKSTRWVRRRAQDAGDGSPGDDGQLAIADYEEQSSASALAPAAHEHNKRIKPCPGQSEDVEGYSNLGDLRMDVADYLASFYTQTPTSSPTSSSAPTPATPPPTLKPSRPPTLSPTGGPSGPPTPSPSEIPTKAPITLRPTNYPTSSIRQRREPTVSPWPTIKLVIIGGDSFGEGPTGPADPTGPAGPSGLSFTGPTRQAAIPPARLPGQQDVKQASGDAIERVRSRISADVSTRGQGPRRLTHRLNEAGIGVVDSVSDSQVVIEDGEIMEEVGVGPTGMAELVPEDGMADLPADASATSELDTTTSIEPIVTGGVPDRDAVVVTFHICPNTKLELDGSSQLDGEESVLLELEMPLIHHQVEIQCLPGEDYTRNCQFVGGSVHILFSHNLRFAGKLDRGDVEMARRVKISGITFLRAGGASILMHDPVGAVTFEGCSWKDNMGSAAIVIDGRYNATEHLTSSPTAGPTLGPTLDPDRTTTTSTLDWSIMMTSTGSTGFGYDDDTGFKAGRWLDGADGWGELTAEGGLASFEEEDEAVATTRRMAAGSVSELDREGPARDGMRSIMPDFAPRSIVSIERCSFSGNKGNATIMVLSHSDEMLPDEEDPGLSVNNDDLLDADNYGNNTDGKPLEQPPSAPFYHSIHLTLRDTTFDSEKVQSSVIENRGGRVQSSGVVFVNNTAASIIRSEHGTVAMTSTEFETNVVQGEAGVVVMDFGSALEENEDTCVSAGVAETANLTLHSARRRLNGTDFEQVAGNDIAASEDGGNDQNLCEGVISGGVCSSFELCSTATPTPSPLMVGTISSSPTTNETSNVPTSINATEGQLEGCFDSWDDLSVAVHGHVGGQRYFTICSGATLLATAPVVISSDHVVVQCGTEKVPSKDCTVIGGFSHFHVTGSPKGVELARLTLKSSMGSSVMALGTRNATLSLTECKWTENTGASAILIHNNESFNMENGTLDILPMLQAEAGADAAMHVEVSGCTFGQNEFSFGAISNIGGTLSIEMSKFHGNLGMGGDIIVANNGSLSVEHSCFNASWSVAPGVIFMQRGSEVTRNKDNFGLGITSGAYSGGTCEDIFLEAEDADCIGSASCAGSCDEFSAPMCMMEEVGEGEAPSPAGEGTTSARSEMHNEKLGTAKIVGIVVGAFVGLFGIFAFCFIVHRRRNTAKSGFSFLNRSDGGAAEPSERKRGFMFRKKRKGEQRGDGGAPDEEGADKEDGTDVIDPICVFKKRGGSQERGSGSASDDESAAGEDDTDANGSVDVGNGDGIGHSPM